MPHDQIAQLDYSAGMQRDVAPHAIDPRGVYDLINGLLDEDASPYRRGGTEAVSSSSAAPGGALITNTSFETNLTGWTGGLTRTNSWSTDGSWSATFTFPDFAQSSTFAAVLGNTYTLTADVKAGPVSRRVVVARLQFLDAGLNVIVEKTAQVASPDTEASIILSRKAPAAAAFVRVKFDCDAQASASGFIDNVQLETAATPSDGLRSIWDAYVEPGARTLFASPTDFGTLAANGKSVVNLGSDGMAVPKPGVVIDGMLFLGGGYIYGGSRKAADYSTGTVSINTGQTTLVGSGTAWSANVDPGMLIQIGATERVYVVKSVTDNTHLELASAYEGANKAGAAYTAQRIYEITPADPYEASEFYEVCANRLIVASGETVKFSEVRKPHDFTVTVGAQNIPNEHKLPKGARLLGYGVVGQKLLIFTAAGLWALDGLAFDIVDAAGNAQHRLQELAREIVLTNAAGLSTFRQAVVAPCIDGIYLIDGTSAPRPISYPVDELYRKYVGKSYRPGLAAVYRGHYFLPILSPGGSEVRDLLVCRLDRPVPVNGRPTFPWSRFSGNGGRIPAFAVRNPDTASPQLLLGAELDSGARVVNCTPYFEPDAAHKVDADNTAHLFALVTRDFGTGDLTENVVQKIRARAELVDGGNDSPEVLFDYGFGRRDQSGAVYDADFFYDDLDADDEDDAYYALDEDDQYFPLKKRLGANDGIDPVTVRVNKRARFIRFRVRCLDPAATLRLRSLELFIRPSEAVWR